MQQEGRDTEMKPSEELDKLPKEGFSLLQYLMPFGMKKKTLEERARKLMPGSLGFKGGFVSLKKDVLVKKYNDKKAFDQHLISEKEYEDRKKDDERLLEQLNKMLDEYMKRNGFSQLEIDEINQKVGLKVENEKRLIEEREARELYPKLSSDKNMRKYTEELQEALKTKNLEAKNASLDKVAEMAKGREASFRIALNKMRDGGYAPLQNKNVFDAIVNRLSK